MRKIAVTLAYIVIISSIVALFSGHLRIEDKALQLAESVTNLTEENLGPISKTAQTDIQNMEPLLF